MVFMLQFTVLRLGVIFNCHVGFGEKTYYYLAKKNKRRITGHSSLPKIIMLAFAQRNGAFCNVGYRGIDIYQNLNV